VPKLDGSRQAAATAQSAQSVVAALLACDEPSIRRKPA